MESQNLSHVNASNETVLKYGLERVPWGSRYVIQLLLAIFGIIGNSMVIHLYLNTRKLTVYSTNRFIAALAVADLITSICIIPIPTLSYVPDTPGGSFYCKIVASSFVQWVSIIASIITLTVLSVERYIAIAYPLRYTRIFTAQLSRIMIIIIWLFAFVFNTFVIYVHHVENRECHVYQYHSKEFQAFIGVSVFIIEYLLPVALMLLSNIRSIQILKARAHVTSREAQQKKSDFIMLKARQRIIYMLLVVIIGFVICWSPDQIAFLAFNLRLLPEDYASGRLYKSFVVLAFANSCVNPILYTLVNKNFRKSIKRHLFCTSHKNKTSVKSQFYVFYSQDSSPA